MVRGGAFRTEATDFSRSDIAYAAGNHSRLALQTSMSHDSVIADTPAVGTSSGYIDPVPTCILIFRQPRKKAQ